jgi:hypothetical protein
MDIEDLKQLNPDLIDEYLTEFAEVSHEIFEMEANAQNSVDLSKLKFSASEGVLVMKMINNPKDYELKKTTNNDITYALARNAEMFKAKEKILGLERELAATKALRSTLYIKKEMLLELSRQRSRNIESSRTSIRNN